MPLNVYHEAKLSGEMEENGFALLLEWKYVAGRCRVIKLLYLLYRRNFTRTAA